MQVIEVASLIAIIALLAIGVKRFNERCQSKFGHMFFSKKAFFVTVAAVALFVAGNAWRVSAIKAHSDTLNAIMLMVVAGLVACGLVFLNVKQTDLFYGLVGSVLQLGAFSALALFSWPFLIVAVVLQLIVILSARPVYIVNR